MIYLLLAIASSSLIAVVLRLSETRVQNQMVMFAVNYVVCWVMSLAYVDWSQGNFLGSRPQDPLLIGLAAGILYLAAIVFLKFNMKESGIVLASTFSKLGVIIPTLMAVVFFGERMAWTRGLGILLAVCAILLINFEKGTPAADPTADPAADLARTRLRKIWLVALLFVGGLTDSMTNVYEQLGSPDGEDGFLFVTFFVAFLLSVVLALRNKIRPQKADLIFGLIIGVPNYFAARFILDALETVDAVLVYPMFSIGTLIVVTLSGIFLFKEEVSRRKACALALIIAALCLLNL